MLRSLHHVEEKCVVVVERLAPPLGLFVRRYQRIIRYIIAGGVSAAVDFLFLYLFTDVWGRHYLLSSILAFIIAFFFSFILQKFWTFQDHSVDRVHTQATLYFIVAALNLLVNTGLMYAFVEWLQVWYITAQFLASALIACESFFISRYIIFKQSGTTANNQPSS